MSKTKNKKKGNIPGSQLKASFQHLSNSQLANPKRNRKQYVLHVQGEVRIAYRIRKKAPAPYVRLKSSL